MEKLRPAGNFNPDDFEGSAVVFQDFMVEGGPVHSSYSTIRYANGSMFDRPMHLIEWESRETVIDQIDFPPTGDWDSWEDLIIEDLILNGTYELVSLTAEGGPNLRSIGATINTVNCSSVSGGYGGGFNLGECPGGDL